MGNLCFDKLRAAAYRVAYSISSKAMNPSLIGDGFVFEHAGLIEVEVFFAA